MKLKTCLSHSRNRIYKLYKIACIFLCKITEKISACCINYLLSFLYKLPKFFCIKYTKNYFLFVHFFTWQVAGSCVIIVGADMGVVRTPLVVCIFLFVCQLAICTKFSPRFCIYVTKFLNDFHKFLDWFLWKLHKKEFIGASLEETPRSSPVLPHMQFFLGCLKSWRHIPKSRNSYPHYRAPPLDFTKNFWYNI